MKKIINAFAIVTSIFLISCGGAESKTVANASAKGADIPAASTVVNEADWELKDVSKIDSSVHFPSFVVKLPKDASIKTDTSLGNLNVVFKNKYKLIISYASVMQTPENKLKGQVQWIKAFKVDTHMENDDVKVVMEDANGFVFTSQLKDIKDSKPEAHFQYLLDDKTGGFITIEDGMSDVTDEAKGDMFSADNVKKIRQIIASSAAFK